MDIFDIVKCPSELPPMRDLDPRQAGMIPRYVRDSAWHQHKTIVPVASRTSADRPSIPAEAIAAFMTRPKTPSMAGPATASPAANYKRPKGRPRGLGLNPTAKQRHREQATTPAGFITQKDAFRKYRERIGMTRTGLQGCIREARHSLHPHDGQKLLRAATGEMLYGMICLHEETFVQWLEWRESMATAGISMDEALQKYPDVGLTVSRLNNRLRLEQSGAVPSLGLPDAVIGKDLKYRRRLDPVLFGEWAEKYIQYMAARKELPATRPDLPAGVITQKQAARILGVTNDALNGIVNRARKKPGHGLHAALRRIKGICYLHQETLMAWWKQHLAEKGRK